jgi:transposase-like protein
MEIAERLTHLEAEVAQLRDQVVRLLAENAELRARLGKDSHNSSKPPSSDGLKRRPPLMRSLRQKTGKKAGGQLGHPGETLHLVATPDAVEEHRPPVCAACQEPLDAALAGVCVEQRQVHELPVARLVVTDHRALRVRCPACQHETVGTFPTEAPSRAQYGPAVRGLAVYLVTQQFIPYERTCDLLADLYGVTLSAGTLATWVQQSAGALTSFERDLKAALRHAPLLHSDETGVRLAGATAWAHVTSTATLTHYAIHAKRGHAATDAIGILPDYPGVSVHDGWKPYQTYTRARHALCNVHHLRELTSVAEDTRQPWARQMKTLLLEMNAATAAARDQGACQVPAPIQRALRARYQALLAQGLAANPPPERRPHHRGRPKQSTARNLLERVLVLHAQVLAFLDDLTIPFDNNQAERDVRMFKVQQKVSGGFRSQEGADAFARLRSYVSTLRKQGGRLLDALRSTFAGPLLYPAFA